MSSTNYSTKTSAVLTIGTISASFDVTTLALALPSFTVSPDAIVNDDFTVGSVYIDFDTSNPQWSQYTPAGGGSIQLDIVTKKSDGTVLQTLSKSFVDGLDNVN